MQRRTFVGSALAASAAISFPRRHALASIFREPTQLQDVDAITGDGKQITLSGRAIADLRAALRGRVLLAGNEGYEEARRIRNPSFDKRPAIIAQITGAADIRTAVDFARDNGGLLLAVKCGGHSLSGQSTCDRGMMIDLSPFRDVRVDPFARRAWVTGGSLLGLVDHETMAHGLVTPLGTVSHTGVGGLVTGGGTGRVARRFGLSVDNLVSVDVITADGQFRRASARENDDLFWGVRGGGGNFGIVTSFQFQLHPMQRRVVGGRIAFPIARAREALTVYADYLHAPDDLKVYCAIMQPPGAAPGMVRFEICYIGAENNAERLLAPIRKLGTPAIDDVKAVDYVTLQRSTDVDDARAVATYTGSGFIRDLPAELISAILDGFQGDPRRRTSISFQTAGGAIARVAPADTAVPHRDAGANMLSGVGWSQGDDPAPHLEYIRQYRASLERFTIGFYVNDLSNESSAAIRANYQKNHERLVAVKNKYDPKNLFRLNANVKPTVGTD